MIGPRDPSSFGKLETFARHNYVYIMYDMHMNGIRIHLCIIVIDVSMESIPNMAPLLRLKVTVTNRS